MSGALILLLLGVSLIWNATTRRLIGVPVGGWQVPAGLVTFVLGLLVLSQSALAMTATRATSVSVHVTDVSARYRLLVEQAAVDEWGVEASPARLAAQLHQESSWNAQARSAVGAQGLAQFMPSTGRWLARQFPELGAYDPWDPAWSARAAAVYDHWLLTRNPGHGACSNWAFAFSAYNGGELALHREQALATKHGRAADRWFGNVADVRWRSPAAWRENRGYVRRILVVLEPAYIEAGWSGQAVCT